MIARTLATTALALLALPAFARADGLPVPVDDAGGRGVASADGSTRWVTARAPHGTVLEKLDTRRATILRTSFLHGRFTIPVVALDGTPDGLSHDATTLVLIKPRASFPRRRTTLAIVDTATLRAHPLTLHGDFSFDAVSPDGQTVYLIQYVDGRDPTKYRVRALDAPAGGLLPKPIVDPNERDEDMSGYPQTRVTSADGRWHYTLYDPIAGAPFVHALDSVNRTARCIDLPLDTSRVDVGSLHLRTTDSTLQVVRKGRPLLNVDTASFAVTKPSAAAAAGPGSRDASSPDAAAITLVALLLLSAGAVVAVARRRQLARR